MNENLNLAEILKDCPKGTKLYSTIFGEVELDKVESHNSYPICIITQGNYEYLTKEGKLFSDFDGECTLFPSRDQRDWSKFKVKQPKFDPKTLLPFDRVLARYGLSYAWYCEIVSMPADELNINPVLIGNANFNVVIPYNDETKHLAGTTDEAPEYYRYWED